MQKNILKKSKRFAIFFVFFILLAHFVFVPSPSKGKGRVRLFPAPQYVRAAGATETWRETDRTWLEKISHPLSTATGENKELTYPDLAVPVGGFTKDSFKGQPPQNWLGVYILAWFNYLIGAIGIIAVVMIMWGGIKWITAGGNASQVDDAKGKIKNAVMGIVLLLCTYTIFKTINPRMLSLQLPTIERVKATPICCKDNTTSKKRTAYNECNKDASGNALETKLYDGQCQVTICESGNTTKCGVTDEANECIGFYVDNIIGNKNLNLLCVVTQTDSGYSARLSAFSDFDKVDVNGSIKKCSSPPSLKATPCEIVKLNKPSLFLPDITYYECVVGNICQDKNQSCVALKDSLGTIISATCR